MDRRRFGQFLTASAAGAVLGGGVPGIAGAATASRLIKPPKLNAGSVVGLIAPGGVVDDAIIQTCVKNLESIGYKVKLGSNIRAAHGGYAGTVAQRLEDLHGMFLDREVRAIWTARGGSGCASLLPGIRYSLVRSNPKILIGYLDITALHLALYRHAGLVTFHGPVAWSTFSDYSVSQMLAVLAAPRPETVIHMSVENSKKAETQSQFALRTLHGGSSEGRLIGGNLTVLCALIGTPYEARIRGSLLFLEEVGEAPYRVDRMLTQLEQSQGLGNAAGIMLGVFQKSSLPQGEASLSLNEVVTGHLQPLAIPAVYGYSFGHIPHQFTLPVGIRARLNTADQTLTLLESAVTE